MKKSIELNETEITLLKECINKSTHPLSKNNTKLLTDIIEKLSQDKIEVYGRRWFQKSYGNTYHTITIYINDENVFTSTDMEYGYDNGYQQTAIDYLIENNLISKPKDEAYKYSWQYFKTMNINFSVQDVDRKKDL